jgi:hypothetical protein
MIEPSKSNSIPNAILIEERNKPITNIISPSDVNMCESQNFRQMAEIKKLKMDSCCYKYCCIYDETVTWDYNFWFYYWYFCFDSRTNVNTDTVSSVTLCDSNCIEGFCAGFC